MIIEVPNGRPFGLGLRPIGDSLPLRTWRGHLMTTPHRYPAEGCHGAPLEGPCPRQAGSHLDVCHVVRCTECNGTGRVPLDHPNRTDMP